MRKRLALDTQAMQIAPCPQVRERQQRQQQIEEMEEQPDAGALSGQVAEQGQKQDADRPQIANTLCHCPLSVVRCPLSVVRCPKLDATDDGLRTTDSLLRWFFRPISSNASPRLAAVCRLRRFIPRSISVSAARGLTPDSTTCSPS